MGAQVEAGDLLDPDSLTGLASGCEVFFNVAGINQLCVRDSELMQDVNIDGVRNAIAACKRAGVRRLVHTSSAVTLGELRGSIGNEASQHRGWFLSEYERTKFQGEQVLLSESGSLEVVAVNPSSVQGPGRATGTARIILDVINGRLPFLVKTQVSLVDIEDCSRGHLLAATEGKPGERYVLSGSTIPVEAALDVAAKRLDRELKLRFVPGWLIGIGVGLAHPAARLAGRRLPFCPEMIRVLRFGHRYDGSRAGTELGLKYTPVEETIARTMDWFQSQGLIDQGMDPA
jgi:dihydroflavonol-4-reductase